MTTTSISALSSLLTCWTGIAGTNLSADLERDGRNGNLLVARISRTLLFLCDTLGSFFLTDLSVMFD